MYLAFFFFNDTATTEIYTLSLHDALPISPKTCGGSWSASRRRPACATSSRVRAWRRRRCTSTRRWPPPASSRSEEHTSELQSRQYLVCRLLLEKKKKQKYEYIIKESILS